MKLSSSRNGGFTLAETAVASAVVAIIRVSIIIGGVFLQRIFAGSDGSLKAEADQLRVLDYIVRDLRQSLTAAVSNSGQTLTLTIPPYLDSSTGNPVIPRVTANSDIVDYGDASSPLTVTYFPANAPTSPSTTYTYQANGQYLIRQVGATQTVISLDCTSLQIAFADQAAPSPAPSPVRALIQASISFAPRFNFQDHSSSNDPERTGTMISATTTSRNPRRPTPTPAP